MKTVHKLHIAVVMGAVSSDWNWNIPFMNVMAFDDIHFVPLYLFFMLMLQKHNFRINSKPMVIRAHGVGCMLIIYTNPIDSHLISHSLWNWFLFRVVSLLIKFSFKYMSSQARIEDCQVICNIWNWHSKATTSIPYTMLGSISSDNRKSMPNYIIIFESKRMKEEIVGGQQTHSTHRA